MNHSTTHAPLYLNNESFVCCLTYSGNNLSIFRRDQVQPYLYRNEIGMRQHGQRSFTAAIKNMESRVLTTHFFVAATIRPLVPDIYKRGLQRTRGVALSNHGLPVMAYHQGYLIATPSRGHPLPPTWDVLAAQCVEPWAPLPIPSISKIKYNQK